MVSRINLLAVALVVGTAAASYSFEAKQSSNSAQAAYISKLVRGARPTKNSQLGRDLAENNANGADISSYSVKFIKCQFVKGFSDDLAEDNDASTVLSTSRFVVFRLCPDQACSTCNSGYGEYLVDMENYLAATVEYRQEEQKAMCNTCDACAAEEDAAADGDANRRLADVDCSTCSDTCDKIENMEANGYVDATAFINCQQLVAADEDAGTSAFYAGAMCASSGSKIKIGVFSDQYCMYLEENLDVESYLADENGNAMKLSHALLRTVYDDADCISCTNVNEDADDGAVAEVNDVCSNLYSYAAKCETLHGFTSGLDAYDENYANQLAQEDVVCDFISSLQSGTYNQTGDIVVGGTSFMSEGGSSTTGGQKFALTFFILGTVGLAVYAAMLHSQLTKDSKLSLSRQGGAMA